jgi:hypothetical protein
MLMLSLTKTKNQKVKKFVQRGRLEVSKMNSKKKDAKKYMI